MRFLVSQWTKPVSTGSRSHSMGRRTRGHVSHRGTIYNSALQANLSNLHLPADSALLQYVDDLLIASETEEGCKQDTVALLQHLAKHRHRASPTKLQWCQSKVVFLGHDLSAKWKALTEKISKGN